MIAYLIFLGQQRYGNLIFLSHMLIHGASLLKHASQTFIPRCNFVHVLVCVVIVIFILILVSNNVGLSFFFLWDLSMWAYCPALT